MFSPYFFVMQELSTADIAGRAAPWKLEWLFSICTSFLFCFFCWYPVWYYIIWFQNTNYLLVSFYKHPNQEKRWFKLLADDMQLQRIYLCWCAKSRIPGFLERIWLNVGEKWRVKIRDLSRKNGKCQWFPVKIREFLFPTFSYFFIPPPNLNISAKFGFRPFSLFLPAGMDCAGMDLDTLVAEHGLTREEAAEVVRWLKAAPLAPWLLTRCFFHLKRDSNIYI